MSYDYSENILVQESAGHLLRNELVVFWHTQGSGKSLTMVMLAKYILMELAPLSPACGHRNRPQRVGRADRCHILQYKTEPRPCQQRKAPREVGWQR